MENIVQNIEYLFLNEAINSPLLFSNLASMEKYISESYTGRSLIELLQNADDAKATCFYLGVIDNTTYVIANNGRIFTDDDMLALCRSGASTKRRGSDTIGYRGIGFKSVVNFANTVHLVSGDIRSTFSRILTSECLNNAKDVPQIRLPHEFHGDQYNKSIDDLLSKGFTSIFVFETANNELLHEVQSFNRDSILFLHSINTVLFSVGNHIEYRIKRKK